MYIAGSLEMNDTYNQGEDLFFPYLVGAFERSIPRENIHGRKAIWLTHL